MIADAYLDWIVLDGHVDSVECFENIIMKEAIFEDNQNSSDRDIFASSKIHHIMEQVTRRYETFYKIKNENAY